MKWLTYLALVVGLIAMGLAGYRLGRAHERDSAEERPPDPASFPAAATPSPPGSRPPMVTVDGNPVPPEEADAIAGAFREVLGRAFAAAVNKSVEDVARQLRLTGDMEKNLLGALPRFGPDAPDDGPILIAIHLIRPGPAGGPPDEVDAPFGERGTIRLTRAAAALDRPVAVTTVTYLTRGRLTQRDRFVVYGPDGEWRAAEPIGAPDRGGGK